MAAKKNRKRNFLDQLFDENGNLIRYTHEDLFGDQPPKVDMLLKPKRGKTFDNVRTALPDGLAQTTGRYMLINYLYGEVDNERPFIRTMACGVLYRQEHNLRQQDVALFVVFIYQPVPGLLDDLGFEPTKRPGVYRSTLGIFADQTVIILQELSNALHNATFKIFARSQKARQDAYKTMLRQDITKMPPGMRTVLAQIAAMTEEEVDNFDEGMAASFNRAISGNGQSEQEPLTELSPAEISKAVEEYLRAQL